MEGSMDKFKDCLDTIGDLYRKAESQTINQSRNAIEHGVAGHDVQRKSLLFSAVYSSILYVFYTLILIVAVGLEFILGYLVSKDKSMLFFPPITFFVSIVILVIFIYCSNKRFSKDDLVKYSLSLMCLTSILVCVGLAVLGFLLYDHITLENGNLNFDYNIFTLKNIIICISFCIICFMIVLRFNFSFYVKKISNLSFVYFYNKNMEKIYIYERDEENYLCGYKDYIKCDKYCEKDFIERMNFFYNKMKVKFKDKDVYLYSFKRDIEKTKRYAGYIKINEFCIANFIKKMELYCDMEQKYFIPEDLFVDLYNFIKTLEHLTAIFLVDKKDVKEVHPVCNDVQKFYFTF